MKLYWNKEINIIIENSTATRTYAAYGLYVFNSFIGVMKWGRY